MITPPITQEHTVANNIAMLNSTNLKNVGV